MQYAWLEKMASAGHIRPEAKARIYADCSALMKQASEGPQLPNNAAPSPDPNKFPWAEIGKKMTDAAVGFGSNILVNHAWSKFTDHRKMKSTLEDIQKARAGILADPVFNDYKEKADARFTELARVAPTLAADAKKAKALVDKALHTGFSNDDMNHLAVLQAVYTANDPSFSSRVHDRMSKKASAERLGEVYADVLGIVKEAGLFSGVAAGIQRGGAAAAQGVASATGGMRPGTAMQILRNVALVSSIPLLAGVGQGLVSEYAAARDKKQMADKLRQSFNEAMQQAKKDDPSQTHGVSLHDNPSEAFRAFQTLVHFAPHVAMHPDSARTFMTRMINNAQFVEIPDVKQLTEIEKNLSNAGGSSPFFEGFSSAAKNLGLGEGVRSTIKDTTEPFRTKTQQAVARDLGMKTRKG